MTDHLTKMLAEVDSERMMKRLAELATRVKLSATEEERESLLTLARDLDALGFATRIIEHEAYISLPGTARVIHAGRDLRAITHSMAAPTSGLEGELVHLGQGTEADFARIDVAGRIALIDGIALEDTTLFANRAGAIAQVHISPNEHLYEMCVSPVWGSPGPKTHTDLPKLPVVSIQASDGAALRALCAGSVRTILRIEAEVDTGWRKTPILEAELGCADDGLFVLLSGHHDTWHFGVMDNGAANVTMLEAARILASRRDAWARGLRICFWSGHSHGRYSGSAWYADAHWSNLADRCIAHVNVDSTGGRSAVTLAKSGVSAQLAGLVADAVRRETGEVHEGRRQGRAADQSFWGIGIASAFGSVSHETESVQGRPVALGPYWHTPDDLIDHVDAGHLARDTRVVLHVLAGLLCDSVPPIDHLRWCDDLAAELTVLKPGAAGLDFSATEDALRSLRTALAVPLHTDALRRIGHHLIPLDHTEGNRFAHDAALPRPSWPVLAPLRTLALAEPEAAPFCRVPARQALNRITHGLRAARREVEHNDN